MPGRTAALAGTLALIALLGYLTVKVIIRDGFTILVALSLLILALFAFGVVGALMERRDE
jgi:hypothetical protein